MKFGKFVVTIEITGVSELWTGVTETAEVADHVGCLAKIRHLSLGQYQYHVKQLKYV